MLLTGLVVLLEMCHLVHQHREDLPTKASEFKAALYRCEEMMQLGSDPPSRWRLRCL